MVWELLVSGLFGGDPPLFWGLWGNLKDWRVQGQMQYLFFRVQVPLNPRP